MGYQCYVFQNSLFIIFFKTSITFFREFKNSLYSSSFLLGKSLKRHELIENIQRKKRKYFHFHSLGKKKLFFHKNKNFL